MIKPGGEISVKYYFVLIVMIHALITGTAVAGTAADKTGQIPTASASDPALSPAAAPEDDALETDIFQEGQADPGGHAMIADPLEGLDELVDATEIPVGPVVFSKEQGVDAVKRGASYLVIGYPLITMPDAREKLLEFANAVRNC